jgi:hypothetical protein
MDPWNVVKMHVCMYATKKTSENYLLRFALQIIFILLDCETT